MQGGCEKGDLRWHLWATCGQMGLYLWYVKRRESWDDGQPWGLFWIIYLGCVLWMSSYQGSYSHDSHDLFPLKLFQLYSESTLLWKFDNHFVNMFDMIVSYSIHCVQCTSVPSSTNHLSLSFLTRPMTGSALVFDIFSPRTGLPVEHIISICGDASYRMHMASGHPT